MRVLQARILEWVAMPSSRGSSQLRDPTPVSSVSGTGRQVLYHLRHLGKPSCLAEGFITSHLGLHLGIV